MSHQTGIAATQELQDAIADAKTSKNVRLVKVLIEEEQMVVAGVNKTKDDWESDYRRFVEPNLDPKQACYLLFRLDSKNAHGFEWIYINWVPNEAPVKQKMLYAATRATLKKEFGDGYFAEVGGVLFGTVVDDCTLDGFKKYVISVKAPPPLTMAEEELEEIKRNETREMAMDKRQETLKGVSFPLTSEAEGALRRFVEGALDYVQYRIEVSTEQVELAHQASKLPGVELCQQVPDDSPRYHLYRYRHTHEGKSVDSVLFVYSMPGYKCSIKERMLYSSCRSGFLAAVEGDFKVTVEKKLEIESGVEVEEGALLECLHPPENTGRKKFAKPTGPGNRGPRRLHKE